MPEYIAEFDMPPSAAPEEFNLAPFAPWGGVHSRESELGQDRLLIRFESETTPGAVAFAIGLAQLHSLALDGLHVELAENYDARSDGYTFQTMTVPEAAEKLGITQQAVLHRIKVGSLQARKNGRDWRIPKAAVAKAH